MAEAYLDILSLTGVWLPQKRSQPGRIAFDVDAQPILEFGVDTQPQIHMDVDAQPAIGTDSDT